MRKSSATRYASSKRSPRSTRRARSSRSSARAARPSPTRSSSDMSARRIACPSPNHDARPDGARVDILVLHYTGMRTAQEALARLCDPAAKVSAHYTIDRGGAVYVHVPEERRAWHAGVSYWAGERNVNARSIGIELVNPGHEFGYEPFPKPQISALIDLTDGILARHPIPPARVVAH